MADDTQIVVLSREVFKVAVSAGLVLGQRGLRVWLAVAGESDVT